MSTTTLTCQQIVELITDYLEGQLAPDLKEQFQKHLDGCTECRHYVRQMEHTIRIAGKVRAEKLALPSKQKLLTLFRGWKNS